MTKIVIQVCRNFDHWKWSNICPRYTKKNLGPLVILSPSEFKSASEPLFDLLEALGDDLKHGHF